MKTRIAVAAGIAGLLVLASCGGGADEGSSAQVRTVEVKALDSLRFEPASVSVRSGEKVRFVITNAGKIAHEFVLGDEEMQMAHENQAGAMDHGMVEAMAAVKLAAGETEEVRVTFDEAGEVLYGCHEPGHYEGGMIGTVAVG